MTRLFDTPLGKMDQLHRILADAGFSAEHVDQVLRNPELAQRWVTILEAELPFVGYLSPEEQVAQMSCWLGEHPEWGFTPDDIPEAPKAFGSQSNSEALLLVLELPDADGVGGVQRTFEAAWDLVEPPEGFTKYRWPELVSDPDHLRLLPGKPHRPGLRWVAIDPLAHWNRERGVRPDTFWADDHDPSTVTAAEGLWLVAYSPDYRANMRTSKLPNMDLPGYQVRFGEVTEEDTWSGCPCLDRWVGDRRLRLGARWADVASPEWAAPRVRELAA